LKATTIIGSEIIKVIEPSLSHPSSITGAWVDALDSKTKDSNNQ
jgi:hypothetical protein